MMDSYQKLRPFLTCEDYEFCIHEAMVLEEDIKFFQMYISRNQKSKARFMIQFDYNVPEFFKMVDTGDYSSKKLQKTMVEYRILSKLSNQITSDSVLYYYDSQMVEIYGYFKKEYDISLEEIIGSFSGSSYLATKLEEKMKEIREIWKKEL